MTDWNLRTERVDRSLELPEWKREGDGVFADQNGNVLWLRNPPSARRWTSDGVLVEDLPVDWTVRETDGGGVLIETAGSAEIDLLELGGAAAAHFRMDAPEPVTVLGAFAPLGGPETTGRFLVGDTVLDTTDFGGRRCPSEQTALSLYRIARARGGPFWDALASHLAAWVAGRVAGAGEGSPRHDLWGEGESHVRFLVDGALLLLAEAERTGAGHVAAAADRAMDGVERFALPWGGGTWYVHDSLERDRGQSDLVLNTHVQALVARLAFGRPVEDGVVALERVLGLAGERRRRTLLGAGLGAVTVLAGRLTGRRGERFEALTHRLLAAAARSHHRSPALRLPGGFIERDCTPTPGAAYYFTVNLHDLGGLVSNAEVPAASRAFRSGVRFARAGFLRSSERAGDLTRVLHPSVLRLAGHEQASRRTADALQAASVSPCIGWPGMTDHLWERLVPGTP